MTYGTSRKNAYSIIEDTLNLRDARVYDRVENPDGTTKSVLNQKETTLAQQKQEAIKEAFKDWIFKDPERRETLVKQYNEYRKKRGGILLALILSSLFAIART